MFPQLTADGWSLKATAAPKALRIADDRIHVGGRQRPEHHFAFAQRRRQGFLDQHRYSVSSADFCACRVKLIGCGDNHSIRLFRLAEVIKAGIEARVNPGGYGLPPGIDIANTSQLAGWIGFDEVNMTLAN